MVRGAPVLRPSPCDRSLPRPRVHVYDLPKTVVPAPTIWRNVRGLSNWLQHSRFHESNPHCADYFLIPSHPQNRISNPAYTPDAPKGTAPRTLDAGRMWHVSPPLRHSRITRSLGVES